MYENLLAIPVFLYTIMFTLFSSAIPLVIIFVVTRILIKSGKKTARSLKS